MSTPTPTASSSSMAPSQSAWKEYKNAEGRPYWFHPVDKKSVWEKPDELKTPREKAIASTKWKEYKSGDRKYYVHSETKETTWNVPQELKELLSAIPAEPSSASASPAPGPAPARPLSHIDSPAVASTSRGTQSPAPHATQSPAAAAQSPAPSAPGPAPGPPPTAPSLGPNGSLTPGGGPFQGPNGHQTQAAPGAPPGPPPGPAPVRPPPTGPAAQFAGGPQPPLGPSGGGFGPGPVFASPQDAFKTLLRNKGVTSTSAWEHTMRDIVTDPLYKALRSLAERKAIFNEYQLELRRQENEEKAKKREQSKPPVIELLKANANEGRLKEYYSWRTVMKYVGDDPKLKSAIAEVGEDDVKPFWDEVRRELQTATEAQQRELRHRNMDLLMSLLRTFEADTTTRWRDAHRTVVESSEWKRDAHLSSMDLSDMITVFDEYIRSIEREATDKSREQDKKRVRDERRRREEFRSLMAQGREEGWIHSKTTWPEVYARLKDDERFTSMLGQRGSTPLDLFFDALDACDRSIEGRIAAVEGLIKLGDAEWDKIDANSTWEDFLAKMAAGLAKAEKAGQKDKWLPIAKEDQELKLVFEELIAIATRASREARKRHERHVRHLIDDARYGLKKAADDDMIAKAESGVAFEEMSSHIEALDIREWRRLDEDIRDQEELKQVKQVTWEKFCRRQKEKAEERREEAAAAAAAAARYNSNNGSRRAESTDRSLDPPLKRKSDAHDLDDRERERVRRREDRDTRRRGGGYDTISERERERRSTRDDEARHDDRKRTRYDDLSAAPTSSKPAAPVVSAGTSGATAADDDDKEEGEV